jgi:hypothetical protein
VQGAAHRTPSVYLIRCLPGEPVFPRMRYNFLKGVCRERKLFSCGHIRIRRQEWHSFFIFQNNRNFPAGDYQQISKPYL